MAFNVADRVRETSTTTGTGTLSLGGAASGYQTFVAGIGSGNNTYYCITDGTAWEIGIGTVTSGTPSTLSRDTVLTSSAGGTTKVNWAAGTRDVFCTLPADKVISPEYGLPAGTAALPALAFNGDTNTGLYQPAADQLAITAGGSLAVLWNSSDQYLAGGLGTAALPIFSFNGDPNTGIYSPAADQVGITTAGVVAAIINASNQYLSGSLGTAALPIFSFNGDPNTGIYSPAADQVGITTAGVVAAIINASNQYLSGSLGTAALPIFSFNGDPNTGIYSSAADQLAVTCGGAARAVWNTSSQYLSGGLGSAALPIFSFMSDPNTGMYSAGGDTLNFATGGASRLTIGSDGVVIMDGGPAGATFNAGNAGSGFEVRSTGAAAMTFHRPSQYAIKIGLDSDNVFKIGSYSANYSFNFNGADGNCSIAGTMTAGAFSTNGSVWSNANLTGNGGIYAGVGVWIAGNLAGHAGNSAGDIGSYGLFSVAGGGGTTPGTLVAGGNLRWSNCWGSKPSVITAAGTWRMMGYIQNADDNDGDSVSIFLRVS
ncbi:hypothetical protein [Pseudomonas juntendi]|uniref:hypothetical protein n=2 Tax=Pseudomonas juntendi TaxID=2666183 RepID=UPI001F1F7089|nr:hypothetical protein [Pseudomonas juntendi]UJM15221.1 hypothetical protein L1P09_25750 [Pseudomonas juntendi]